MKYPLECDIYMYTYMCVCVETHLRGIRSRKMIGHLLSKSLHCNLCRLCIKSKRLEKITFYLCFVTCLGLIPENVYDTCLFCAPLMSEYRTAETKNWNLMSFSTQFGSYLKQNIFNVNISVCMY